MSKLSYIIIASFLSLGVFAQPVQLVKPNTPADSKNFLRAVALYSDGFYEQAYSLFSQISAIYPDDDAVAYYYGCSATMLDKNAEAEVQLLRAHQLDSTNTSYIYSLVAHYDKTQNPRQLALYGEKLLRLSPKYMSDPDVISRIADAQLMIGKDSLALNYYDRLLEFVPNYPPAIVSKLYLYRKSGDEINFFICLEQMIENEDIRSGYKTDYLSDLIDTMTPQFYWMWRSNLTRLINLNLSQDPENLPAQVLRIRLSLIKGEYDDVIARCETMIKSAKAAGDKAQIAQAYSILGDTYSQLEKRKQACEAYKQALKYEPNNVLVLNNYAYLLSEERGQLRNALKMSTKVVELEPDNATYLDTHGWILYLLGKAKEAKPYFKHAMIYGGKESAVVLEHYSQVLQALGENDLAKYYKNLAAQKRR